MPRKTDRPVCPYCGQPAHYRGACVAYPRLQNEALQQALGQAANLLEAAIKQLERKNT